MGEAFGWILVVAVPIWVGRICLSPRFAATFPREARWAWGTGLAWCLAVVLCCLWMPATLPLFVAAVVLGWAALVGLDWRSRRDSHGTPPGRLSVLDGIRALVNRDYYLRNFERQGPIFKMSQFGAPTICVLGLDRIEKLIKGQASSLGPSTLPISNGVEGNFLRYMAPETHGVYGRLFRRAMSGPFSDRQTGGVAEICRNQICPLVGTEGDPFPVLQAIARLSLNHLLLGLDATSDEGQRFDQLARGFASAGIGWSLGRRDQRSLEEMRQILNVQVERQSAAEGNTATPPSVLLQLRQQDPQMPDRVCLDNLIVMHRIATGNVSSLLGWLLFRWGTESDIVAAVRAAPAGEIPALLRTFLLETLRTSQSEYLYRRVAQEFEFDGHRFPRGWLLRGCVWESHRTSPVIAEPWQFRLRGEPLAYDRRHFTPLGMGAHACNGGDINELICLTFLEHLQQMSRVHIRNGEPLQRQTRHWSHWQPNLAMRVTLEGAP